MRCWMLPLLLLIALAALPASAQEVPPPPANRTVTIAGVEVVNGSWVDVGVSFRLEFEWARWCLQSHGLPTNEAIVFDSLMLGIADSLRMNGRPIGGFTLGMGTARIIIVWQKDQVEFLDQRVHEFIHALGGYAAGEFPPGAGQELSTAFAKCLPSLRFK